MCLIHDIVEIDAGDTYAYDEVAKQSQKEREEKAAERIFGLLPDDQREELFALFSEFEEGKTPEARFARALDNVQPAMLNCATDGAMWRQNGVRLSQILNRNKNTADGSAVLWDYAYEHFIRPHVEKGNILDNA